MANTLDASPKLDTLTTRFNLRSVENRFAMILMMKHVGLDFFSPENHIRVYYQLRDHLGFTYDQMLELKDVALKSEPYSKAELIELFGLDRIYEAVSEIGYGKECFDFNENFYL